MIEENDDEGSYSQTYLDNIKNENEPEELEYQINEGIKSIDDLINFYEEGMMEENDYYYIYISNNIALNLQQSLSKLRKGHNYQKLFESPCQIKIYAQSKLMIIYLVISHNFLRIKAEILFLRENKMLVKKKKSISKDKDGLKDIELSDIDNIELHNYNDENEKEIIFTIELKDFFSLLDLSLCENKDYPLILALDENLSVLTGKSLCTDLYNQSLDCPKLKYKLLKNEIFCYSISSPEKLENRLNDSLNMSKILKENDNSLNKDFKGENHNEESKNTIKKDDKNDKYEKYKNEFLENKFTMELKSSKYMIEGQNLLDLYTFMKGLNLLYDDLSTHNIGISFTNDKALFFCLNMENLNSGEYLDKISSNISQQLRLNIKSLKNPSFTNLPYGFNSFYRTKFLSKFITSFYNKNDKRLLIKVSNNGKMVLSYTFSDPKNDNIQIQNENNEQIIKEDDENNNDSESSKKNVYKDRLLDDENRGNIVEMIFLPYMFDVCKNYN